MVIFCQNFRGWISLILHVAFWFTILIEFQLFVLAISELDSLPFCPCKPSPIASVTIMKPLYTASSTSAWLFIKWCVVWVVVVVQLDRWSLKITNSLFRPFTQISRSQRLLPWEERRDLCWGYNCGSERAETKKGITNTKNNKLYNEKNDSVS